MLRIHARRHGNAARWQVTVDMPDGTMQYFDRVDIEGPSHVDTKQGGESPHVFMVPAACAKVYGISNDVRTQLQ